MEINLAYVAERDTDFALIREMIISKKVRELFLNKVGVEGELIKIFHSLSQEEQEGKVGESDIVFIFEEKNRRKFAIFVEDKIATSQQPRQCERYNIRALKLKEKEKFDRYFVILFAPQNYINTKASTLLYETYVSHDEIIDICCDALDKKIFIESCKVYQGKNKIVDKNITLFWNELIDYVKKFPQINFTKKKIDRGPNSLWPEFTTNVKGLTIYYKSDRNIIDLTFSNMANKRVVIKNIIDKLNIDIDDYIIDDANKSLVIRKILPSQRKINFRRPFKDQLENIDHCLYEIIKLIKIANVIGNAGYSSFPTYDVIKN